MSAYASCRELEGALSSDSESSIDVEEIGKRKMNILAIDIGGTGLKAALLDAKGNMLTERVRVPTPHPCFPKALLQALASLIEPLPKEFDCISVGFPGVVKEGRIITAPLIGPEELSGLDLGRALTETFNKPVRVINDADMQGLAAVQGKGIEMVITLGTGFGSALFLNGKLAPHLELSIHPFRKGETYNEQLGNAALARVGKKKWNRRVERAIVLLRSLTNFDKLYIGGGNARNIKFQLDRDVQIIPNEDGIKGGAWLWKDETR
jgi:polyphosphate glucokinase